MARYPPRIGDRRVDLSGASASSVRRGNNNTSSTRSDHGAAFSTPLKDTHDGLRGFEICDPDRYVLFFGRPR